VPRIARKKKKKKREDLQESMEKIGNAWIAFSAMHLGWVSIQSLGPHLNDWKNLSFLFLFLFFM